MDIFDILRALSYAIIAVGSIILAILYLQYYRIKRQTTFLAKTMVAIMLALAAVGLVGMFVIWCRDIELSHDFRCEQQVLSAYTWALFALAIAVLVSVADHVLVLVRHNKDMDADEAVTKAAIPAPVAAPPAPVAAPVQAQPALAAKTADVAYSAVEAAQATADVANKAVDVAKAAASAGSAPAAAATADVAERSATVATLAGDVATLATDVATEISKITQEGKAAE